MALPSKLLIVCDEGHSTSILMARVRQVARERGVPISVACDGYTGGLWGDRSADVILTAPQVAYRQDDLEARSVAPVALGTIPFRVFGALDADAILDEALELYDAYEDYRRAFALCEELAPREVLVCCAGGASSSLLVWRMQQAADAANLHVHVQFSGVGHGKFLLERVDCVLIAPQVRFAEQELQDFNDRGIPVGHIPWRRYGQMDGEFILGEAVKLLEEGGTPPFIMDAAFKARWEEAVAAFERARTEARKERDAIVKRYGKRNRRQR